jgi:hypothetical protein
MKGGISGPYLFSNPDIFTHRNCTSIKMSSTSQQMVKNDRSDFSNNHHAMVAPNIRPTVARLHFHKMISAAER